MISDGYLVDGSWKLRVFVTDLQAERTLRVKGDLHVGGVMLKLVEDLGKFQFTVLLYLSKIDTYLDLPVAKLSRKCSLIMLFACMTKGQPEAYKIKEKNSFNCIYALTLKYLSK